MSLHRKEKPCLPKILRRIRKKLFEKDKTCAMPRKINFLGKKLKMTALMKQAILFDNFSKFLKKFCVESVIETLKSVKKWLRYEFLKIGPPRFFPKIAHGTAPKPLYLQASKKFWNIFSWNPSVLPSISQIGGGRCRFLFFLID